MTPRPDLTEVLLDVDGAVATITLNKPEHRNPLSAAMIRDLRAAFAWGRAEAGVAAVVLTGAGDRAFCAGVDLSAFSGERSVIELHLGRHALAGGFGLACACDLLVAVETASFGTPEINVGVWPMMIQALLCRKLPQNVVLEMVMLGDRWTANQLQSYGLVNRVTSADRLDEETRALTGKLAEKSTAIMRLGRDAFYQQWDMDLKAALEYLHGLVTLVTLTEDSAEGRRAFFEKRKPEFKGR